MFEQKVLLLLGQTLITGLTNLVENSIYFFLFLHPVIIEFIIGFRPAMNDLHGIASHGTTKEIPH